MDVKIMAAIISGLVALMSLIFGFFKQKKITILEHELNLKNRELDKKEESEKLISKYTHYK